MSGFLLNTKGDAMAITPAHVRPLFLALILAPTSLVSQETVSCDALREQHANSTVARTSTFEHWVVTNWPSGRFNACIGKELPVGPPPLPQPARPVAWRVSRGSTDRMTGAVTWLAESPYADPDRRMAPPYNDTRARLFFRCRSGEDFFRSFAVLFTDEPNLTTFWGDEGYPRIRWDSEVIRMDMTRFGHLVAFIDDDAAERRIRRHNKMLLELHWYGNGAVYFEFPLAGAANAIDDARQQCR